MGIDIIYKKNGYYFETVFNIPEANEPKAKHKANHHILKHYELR
jgi:hypothetical protein